MSKKTENQIIESSFFGKSCIISVNDFLKIEKNIHKEFGCDTKKQFREWISNDPDTDYIKSFVYTQENWSDDFYAQREYPYHLRFRGEAKFIRTVYQNINYFVTENKLNKKQKEILTWFIEKTNESLDIPNTWDTWDTVSEGVAYRDGAGYRYALFAKKT